MKTWQIVLIVLGVIFLLMVLACGGLFYWGFNRAMVLVDEVQAGQENINVVAEVPERVGVGEEFQIRIEVTSDAEEPQRLLGVLLTEMPGMEVLSIDPEPDVQEDVEAGEPFHQYDDLWIQPGGTQEIVVTARAGEDGVYWGVVSVMISRMYIIVQDEYQVTVGDGEPAAEEPAAP